MLWNQRTVCAKAPNPSPLTRSTITARTPARTCFSGKPAPVKPGAGVLQTQTFDPNHPRFSATDNKGIASGHTSLASSPAVQLVLARPLPLPWRQTMPVNPSRRPPPPPPLQTPAPRHLKGSFSNYVGRSPRPTMSRAAAPAKSGGCTLADPARRVFNSGSVTRAGAAPAQILHCSTLPPSLSPSLCTLTPLQLPPTSLSGITTAPSLSGITYHQPRPV